MEARYQWEAEALAAVSWANEVLHRLLEAIEEPDRRGRLRKDVAHDSEAYQNVQCELRKKEVGSLLVHFSPYSRHDEAVCEALHRLNVLIIRVLGLRAPSNGAPRLSPAGD
jgi:hypothetical protein